MGKPDAGPIKLDGVTPSAAIRRQLAEEGEPVILSFSCGKDSIACWQALLDEGIDVRPYYMYTVPGLAFVEDTLKRYEDLYQTRIRRYPHPALFGFLSAGMYQPPGGRLATIAMLQLPRLDIDDINILACEDNDVADDTWVADGVRASDSSVRRMVFKTHGPMRESNGKVSPIWDWRISHVRDCLNSHNLPWPVDYEWFGRSFDGLDRRFLGPLKEHAPDDYARVLELFPLADMDLLRHDLSR